MKYYDPKLCNSVLNEVVGASPINQKCYFFIKIFALRRSVSGREWPNIACRLLWDAAGIIGQEFGVCILEKGSGDEICY